MAEQDNITHNGICPGRIKGGEEIHTHTHDTNYLTLLLHDI